MTSKQETSTHQKKLVQGVTDSLLEDVHKKEDQGGALPNSTAPQNILAKALLNDAETKSQHGAKDAAIPQSVLQETIDNDEFSKLSHVPRKDIRDHDMAASLQE